MKKNKLNVKGLSHKPVAKISAIVFYALIGISVLLFALFRLVGFDMPYIENPEYTNSYRRTRGLYVAACSRGIGAWRVQLCAFGCNEPQGKPCGKQYTGTSHSRSNRSWHNCLACPDIRPFWHRHAYRQRSQVYQHAWIACVGHVYRHIIGFDSLGNSSRGIWRNT